jgi:SAM-dependent methyltransferase
VEDETRSWQAVLAFAEGLASQYATLRAALDEEGEMALGRAAVAHAREIQAYDTRVAQAVAESDYLRGEVGRLRAERAALLTSSRTPGRPPALPRLTSCLCTQARLESDVFRAWAARMGQAFALHRQLWEFCYIAQALDERGLLGPGRRGLGFAAGGEPLTALFAALGCEVVVTGPPSPAVESPHAPSDPGLRHRISFREVDVDALPDKSGDFDFAWSAGALEHLGSIESGKRFLTNMIRCLRPGGVAVHTTAFNLSSDESTIDSNDDGVIFRRRDVRDVLARLRGAGHQVEEPDFNRGDGWADEVVDPPPHQGPTHLKLLVGVYAATSLGLIVTRAARPSLLSRLWRRAA